MNSERTRLRGMEAFQYKGFRYFFASEAVSSIGGGFTLVALPFLAYELGKSPSAISYVLAARLIPNVAFLLVGGALTSRLLRSSVLVAFAALRCSLQAAVCVLGLLHLLDLAELILISAIYGLSTAISNPIARAIRPHLMAKRNLDTGVSLLYSVVNATATFAPALGGLLLTFSTPQVAFGVDAFAFGISAVLLSRIPPINGTRVTRLGIGGEIGVGLREVAARRWIGYGLAHACIFQFAVVGALSVLGPLLVMQTYEDPAPWGLILVAEGVGALLGSILGAVLPSRFRGLLSLRVSYFAVFIGVSPAPVLLALGADLWIILVAFLVYGVSLGRFDVEWQLSLHNAVPERAVGTVFAVDSLVSTGLRPVGLLLVTPLATAVGSAQAMAACAAIAALVTVPFVLASTLSRPTTAPPPIPDALSPSPSPVVAAN